MWALLTGACVFIVLAGTAFCLGRIAKRRFPKSYAIVDKFLYSIDLILIAGFFVLLYFTR